MLDWALTRLRCKTDLKRDTLAKAVRAGRLRMPVCLKPTPRTAKVRARNRPATHKQEPKPFIWKATARDILQNVIRANSRLSGKKNAAPHWLADAPLIWHGAPLHDWRRPVGVFPGAAQAQAGTGSRQAGGNGAVLDRVDMRENSSGNNGE